MALRLHRPRRHRAGDDPVAAVPPHAAGDHRHGARPRSRANRVGTHGSAQARGEVAGRDHDRGDDRLGDGALARDSEYVRGALRPERDPAASGDYLGRPVG